MSYQKDRRNTYGESPAASRKSIRRRKAGVNRAFRRAEAQRLGEVAWGDDAAEAAVNSVRRNSWKKKPDTALGEVLDTELIRLRDGTPGAEYPLRLAGSGTGRSLVRTGGRCGPTSNGQGAWRILRQKIRQTTADI